MMMNKETMFLLHGKVKIQKYKAFQNPFKDSSEHLLQINNFLTPVSLTPVVEKVLRYLNTLPKFRTV